MKLKSLPIQDEVGGEIDFQHKMRLSEKGNPFMIEACD